MSRILVVDDELGISELIRETLQRCGYAVETAFNGHQGIRRFEDADVDLVVTDMGLPDMDGSFVVRHIRNSSRPLTPVIGISGTPWLLDGAGCDAVLPKPFPLRALIDLVGRLIQINMVEASPPGTIAFNTLPAF